ncbi:hypothetical protein V8E36_005989 [Tilletia maclaganii]
MASAQPAQTAVQLSVLPIEVLSYILEFVAHRDLPACTRVSKLFHTIATPLLYRRLWLRDQKRLHKVFTLLGARADLAALVRIVEIRVFPFSLLAEELEKLELAIIRTFQHAVDLEELIWTRTGSLNDRVLRAIFDKVSRLRLLELTGDSRSWSPSLLIQKMPAVIERFSLIMPDRNVMDFVPEIARRVGAYLQSLSILSNNAAFIRDASIEAAAPYLTNLTRLSLVGCKNVTGYAVLSVLRRSQAGVAELSLEGLSLMPGEIDELSKHTSRLRTLAITYPHKSTSVSDFHNALAQWVESSTHLRFTFYRMSGKSAAPGEEEDASDDDEEEAEASEEPGLAPPPQTPTRQVPHALSSQDAPDTSAASTSTNTNAAGPSAADAATGGNNTDDTGEALLPFSSLHINSPYLQRYRNQIYHPTPPIGTPLAGQPASRGGQPSDPLLSSSFLHRIIAARGKDLVQLRIHHLAMTTEQLGLICHHCVQLEELVVHLFEPEVETIKAHLCALPRLRSVHILASFRSGLEMNEEVLRDLAASSSSDVLRQIGFRNRVWEVVPTPLQDVDAAGHAAAAAEGTQNRRPLFLEEIDEPASAYRRSLDP